MKRLNRMNTPALLALWIGLLLCAGDQAGRVAFAKSAAQDEAPAGPSKSESKSETPAASGKDAELDPYQRSGQVLYIQRFGKSGVARGEEIYYMKCWICHNDFTVKADPKAAPTLRDIYKRPKLMSGQPVNDDTIRNQIREGSARMPTYKYVFTDKDLTDLVTYLREKCCFDENNPPANPLYKGQ
jgi:hypothetical protein